MGLANWLKEHGGLRVNEANLREEKPLNENKGYGFEIDFVNSLEAALRSANNDCVVNRDNGAHKNVKAGGFLYSASEIAKVLKSSDLIDSNLSDDEALQKVLRIDVPNTRREGLTFTEYGRLPNGKIDKKDVRRAKVTGDDVMKNNYRTGNVISDVIVVLKDVYEGDVAKTATSFHNDSNKRIFISLKFQDAAKKGTLALAGYGLNGNKGSNKKVALSSLFGFSDVDAANIVNMAQNKITAGRTAYSTVSLQPSALRNLMFTSLGVNEEVPICYMYVMGKGPNLEIINLSKSLVNEIVNDVIFHNSNKKIPVAEKFVDGTSNDFTIKLKSDYLNNLKIRFRTKKSSMSTLEIDYNGFNMENVNKKVSELRP